MSPLETALVLLLGTVLASPLASAMSIAPSDVQASLNQAILVAKVRILSNENHSDPVQHATFESHAEVLEVVSHVEDGGEVPTVGETISIVGPGGEWNGVGVMLSGYPRPRTGSSYTAHLKRHGSAYSIAGFEFGLESLTSVHHFTRNRTDGSDGDGTGPFLFWDSSYFPIPYFISAPSFANHADFISAADASFKTWRDPQNVRVEFLPLGCSQNTRNENDGVNTIILVTQNWIFDPAIIAITRNFYIAGSSAQAGMILDTDIMLNGVDHDFSTTGDPSKHDVQNILTHEIGHFIGLGHETTPVDPDATMFAVASPGETKKRTLHANDLAGLFAAYSGVGQKFPTLPSPSCRLSDQKYGCGAVHNGDRGPGSLLYVVFFLLVNVGMGRWYSRRRLC